MKWNSLKPFKKLLVSGGGSTAGRNNAGRITIYHRGGGAKRLHRNVDLKRTTSSMGIVERIEYDPNRSSRLALVRWVEGVQPNNPRKDETGFVAPHQKSSDPITSNVAGQFPLSCLASGLLSDSNVVGDGNGKEGRRKMRSVKDVFVAAFSSKSTKEESLRGVPRVAVAGAKPAVFAPRVRGQVTEEEEKAFALSDVKRWNKDSVLWEHRLKRKAAVPWSSFVREDPVGLSAVVAAKDDRKPKAVKNRVVEVDRAPLTYIIASNDLEPGKMVMNVDLPKHEASGSQLKF